jgi:trehalose synthase
MAPLEVVELSPLPPERFESVLEERYPQFANAIVHAQALFEGRTIWNVNSTAKGGGVAEMLRSLLAYTIGARIDARWVVIDGSPDFFRVTKRIHNKLHGAPGDGGPLDEEQRRVYEAILAANGKELASLISEGDVVILHDPQTAGLVEVVKDTGAAVIWRCHVGLDTPNDEARSAWRFLRPYVQPANAYVFSRRAFVWDDLDEDKIAIIPPSIDAFSPKNQDLSDAAVAAILTGSGIVSNGSDAEPVYERTDGRQARVERKAEVIGGPLPRDATVVVQVSRWDRLKDPGGVMRGFADHVAPRSDAHLMLAGPSVESVADDPEGIEVIEECTRLYDDLPVEARERVHLATLPMEDGEENAVIVNAIQRHGTIVVQKSLAEGFGLTVAEAMWKSRPVVASRIGGIQDQIEDGRTGLLVDDPKDLSEFGSCVLSLLEDAESAERMGQEARSRVRTDFLGPRHLMQYLELVDRLLT